MGSGKQDTRLFSNLQALEREPITCFIESEALIFHQLSWTQSPCIGIDCNLQNQPTASIRPLPFDWVNILLRPWPSPAPLQLLSQFYQYPQCLATTCFPLYLEDSLPSTTPPHHSNSFVITLSRPVHGSLCESECSLGVWVPAHGHVGQRVSSSPVAMMEGVRSPGSESAGPGPGCGYEGLKEVGLSVSVPQLVPSLR